MKILLINPPRSPENMILASAPEEAAYFIHKKLIGPPLGLLTVAAAVKDHDVTVFDMKGEYDLHADTPALPQLMVQLLEQHKPDVVGVTAITSEFDYTMEIFGLVKQYNPEITTIAGGLHSTLMPHDFHDPVVDVVCPGHSAFVFKQVVDALERKEAINRIAGIIDNTGNKFVSTGPGPTTYNAADEHFLMPDRSHLERWRQTYVVGKSPGPTTYMFTSLGCPYSCTFCSIWPGHQGDYFQRTIDSLIEELKLIDYDIVRFADANTVVHVPFMHQLFDRIKAEGIHKEYIMDIRADTAVDHPDLIEKMARAGLKVVITGFESFRDAELKAYNKKSEAVKIHQAIDIFHANGVMLRGNYVVPAEYNEDDFEALAAYAHSHKVTYAGFTILTPMPGTVFYRQVKDQITDHDYKKYNFFNSVMKTTLPLDKFYENMGKLWLIKKGTDVI